MKRLGMVLIIMLALPILAADYQVDVLDMKDGRTQIILTDQCQEKFIETFRNEDLGVKPSKWLKMLAEANEIDKCIKKEVDSE